MTDITAWHSAGSDEPGDIQRDLDVPGSYWALIGPDEAGRHDWSIISRAGTIVDRGNVSDEAAAKADVAAWETDHAAPTPEPPRAGERRAWTDSEIPDDALDRALGPVTEPDPETWVQHIWDAPRDLRAILADLDSAAMAGQAYESPDLYHELADTVRDALTPIRGGTGELAAEADRAARTTAPPVPGITQNAGYTVYAVIRTNHVPGEPSDDAWIVAAADDRGEHATWNAYASDSPGPEHERRLHYDTGHYHSPGQGTDSEALADLANRAGVFSRLTELCSGMATREAFQGSHGTVLEELSSTYGVGRARVRAGLLEAAALGYARVSWHGHGERQDYGIRYDRYRCVFTWNREH